LCLIVKNEEQTLHHCLESIKQVADEIIVVDTGSQDKTCNIAKQYGARVFHFPWQDDFAKARNFSLKQASGNWILVLDADEIISEKDFDTLRKLTAYPAEYPTVYQLLTRNYIHRNDIIGWHTNDGSFSCEERGCGWIPSLKSRLWSNNAKIYFSYPVHEIVTPSLNDLGISPHPCPIIIHHYGKLNQLKADEKGKKYYELGLKKLDEMNSGALPLRELAIQAGILGRFAEAVDLWQRYLKLETDNAEAYLNLGTALFNQGMIKEALRAAEKSSQLAPQLKESYFNRALYELHLGRPKTAEKKLAELLKKVPEYSSAKFLYAATICCKNGVKAGSRAFHKIENKSLTCKMIEIAGEELACTLKKAGQIKDAKKLKKATTQLIQF